MENKKRNKVLEILQGVNVNSDCCNNGGSYNTDGADFVVVYAQHSGKARIAAAATHNNAGLCFHKQPH